MLHPFKATRPTRDKAYLVATRSYISYEPYELEDKLENNPYTFLHVINPSALPEASYERRFEAVRERFDFFIQEGVFLQEELATYYLYRQKTPTHEFLGVIGLLDADSVAQGKTLPHEKTLERREKLFEKYLDTTGFQAEPVLVFGSVNEAYERCLAEVQDDRPEYEFSSTDRYLHQLWPVPEKWVVVLQEFFTKAGAKYIADGHHRLASSVRVAEGRPDNPLAQGVLCMFMSEKQLSIQAFERWMKLEDRVFDLNDLDAEYSVVPLEGPSSELGEHNFEMYWEGRWYGLIHKDKEVDEVLATQLLLDSILKPLFEVHDERNDSRLSYVRQSEADMSGAMRKRGYNLGFRLPPVSVKLLKEIAENRGSMPPKSTYIEPKLRSGLLLHVFK
tara:strand:+ start:2165 stop:3334 length:1170 start_codon:yes stop_codon:yes gene_type:complete